MAVRAPADGYTLVLVSNGPYAIAPGAVSQAELPPREGSSRRGPAGNASPQVFAANPQAGFTDIKGLVEQAKKKPLTFGSSGNGSTQHLTMEYFEKTAGITLMHGAVSRQRGRADAGAGRADPDAGDSVPASLAQIKAGRLKAIAVTSLKRSSSCRTSPRWRNRLPPASSP